MAAHAMPCAVCRCSPLRATPSTTSITASPSGRIAGAGRRPSLRTAALFGFGERSPKGTELEPKPENYTYVLPDDAPWPPAYAVSSTVGPRLSMEDTTHLVPQTRCGYFYCAVFDGHGGASAAGYLASPETGLHEQFSDCVDSDPAEEVSPGLDPPLGVSCPLSLRPILVKTFKRQDKKLIRYLCELEDPECFSGATATAVLLRRDNLIAANVGDSRAVIARGGKSLDLTLDHRVGGRSKVAKSEEARVKEAGGWVQEGRVCGILAVSRAFGDVDFKSGRQDLLDELKEEGWKEAQTATMEHPVVVPEPDVTELGRSPEDEFLVVATDGVWDVLSSDKVVRHVRKELGQHGDLQRAADSLVDAALRMRSQDNVSVVVVDLRH